MKQRELGKAWAFAPILFLLWCETVDAMMGAPGLYRMQFFGLPRWEIQDAIMPRQAQWLDYVYPKCEEPNAYYVVGEDGKIHCKYPSRVERDDSSSSFDFRWLQAPPKLRCPFCGREGNASSVVMYSSPGLIINSNTPSWYLYRCSMGHTYTLPDEEKDHATH